MGGTGGNGIFHVEFSIVWHFALGRCVGDFIAKSCDAVSCRYVFEENLRGRGGSGAKRDAGNGSSVVVFGLLSDHQMLHAFSKTTVDVAEIEVGAKQERIRKQRPSATAQRL